MRLVALALAGLVGFGCDATALAQAHEPAGRRPQYTSKALSDVPNAAAMTQRLWVPGLDEGYVPQGLTVIDGALHIGTYRSENPAESRGPCRLYRVDPNSGEVTGRLDLPPECGHSGGLAKSAPGRLWVADTRAIFEVELGPANDPAIGRVVRAIKLAGDVKGSFAAGSGDALWLGTYAKEPGARLYKFLFDRLKPELREADAALSVPMPTDAQGAAFDGKGQLWVTRGGSKYGELLRLDPASGAILARHAMPAGLEDISFDAQGGLWALSEAGSKRWLGWATFFPVAFRLDVAKLR